ncbi:MAG: hypothetical protein AB7D57_01760 [Desulfovibrionaceae bacterium]
MRVNGAAWPEAILGELALSWAHRNRVQQTAYVVTQDEASITPEDGTTYTVRVYGEAGALLRTVSGLTGTAWTYAAADEAADSGLAGGRLNGALRVTLAAERDGYAGWQAQERRVDRAGWGYQWGNYYGGI